jgi:hypothetical protein
MNEGNVFVCATSMKGNKSELCVLLPVLLWVERRRESQIKNQNCVLVTHFHDVFPEFSTRHSVNDILNTFDFFSNKNDFQENEKFLSRRAGGKMCLASINFKSFFCSEKQNFQKSLRRRKKFALHHFEGCAGCDSSLKSVGQEAAIEAFDDSEHETAAIDFQTSQPKIAVCKQNRVDVYKDEKYKFHAIHMLWKSGFCEKRIRCNLLNIKKIFDRNCKQIMRSRKRSRGK